LLYDIIIYLNIHGLKMIKSDYINERQKEFENPVGLNFDKILITCDIKDCNIAVKKYSWCKKLLCLKHFFKYH